MDKFNQIPSTLATLPVMLVDDDEAILRSTGQWLELVGHTVHRFNRAEPALQALNDIGPAVVVTDIKMPGMDGLELAKYCVQFDPDVPVILVTAHGDISMAVQAMRDGAFDFLEKPFDPDVLTDRIRRAMDHLQLKLENRELRRLLDEGVSLENTLIGRSAPMLALRRQMLRLAQTPVDVVIWGETGTGKERVARCLHDWSARSHAPFVAVNCGAIPEALIESELFGHEAGAFTGAAGKRVGKLEYAQGGTLFLDEIESMPMSFQVKLLRVLQERKLERLGSNRQIDLDLWVVAAAKVSLREAADRGEFREDLYYRFNVAELRLPALRQRREDIPLLFDFFTQRAARQFNRDAPVLSEDDVAILMSESWPGNVRQLRNIAERHVLAIGDTGTLREALKGGGTGEWREEASSPGLNAQVQAFEKQLIITSLKRHDGNVQAALDDLQLPRRTLNNKMAQYGIRRQSLD